MKEQPEAWEGVVGAGLLESKNQFESQNEQPQSPPELISPEWSAIREALENVTAGELL